MRYYIIIIFILSSFQSIFTLSICEKIQLKESQKVKAIEQVKELKRKKELLRYEKYPIKEIETISKNLLIDPRGVVRELNKKLNDFYLIDISNKKIQYNQDINLDIFSDKPAKRKEWNINLLRLYVKKMQKRVVKKAMIKEAPNLYLSHFTMARALLKLKKPHQAAFHLKMALRYRTLRMTKDIFLSKDRFDLLDKDDPERKIIQQYKKIKEEIEKDECEIEEKKKEAIIIEDQIARQKIKDQKLLDDQLKKNKALLKQILNQQKNKKKIMADLEIQRNKISTKWNKQSAIFLNEMANLTKKLEDSIKERLKVLNKKAIYKTSFNQTLIHDYAKNRKYTAYANILSIAHKLDPSNPQILYKLGEEYRTSQNVRKAIYSYETALSSNKITEKENQLNNFTKGHIYLALGGLYHRIKRYVDSTQYYEKALNKMQENVKQYEVDLKKQKEQIVLEKDLDKRNNLQKQYNDLLAKKNNIEKKIETLIFQLANLHTLKTGKYKRAIQLYNEYLNLIQNLDPNDISEKAELFKIKFHIYKNLAIIYEKKRAYKKWKNSLERAQDIHHKLFALITEQKKQINILNEKLLKAKSLLRNDTTKETLNPYLAFTENIKKAKVLLSTIESVTNSLPLKNIYFSLGRYWELKHGYRQALEVYQDAERLGIYPDEARRHIDRIKKR